MTSLQRTMKLLITLAAAATLTHCSTYQPDSAPSIKIDPSSIKDPIPRALPKSRYGNPSSYVIRGKRYYVLPSAKHYNQTGIASWYGTKFHGQLTSTREPYNMFAMTAASPVLPIPCYVRVTNLENGRQAIVKVNDRGPFALNRIIDLSYVAAIKLGYANKGTAMVRVTSIDVNAHPPQHPHPRLYLQLGAFSDKKNAKILEERARRLTRVNVSLHTTYRFGVPLYKVWVGPIVGTGESDQLVNLFHRKGYQKAITVIR